MMARWKVRSFTDESTSEVKPLPEYKQDDLHEEYSIDAEIDCA